MLSTSYYLERIYRHTSQKETRDGVEYRKTLSSLHPFKECFWKGPGVRNELFFQTWGKKRSNFTKDTQYLFAIAKTAYLKGLPENAIIALLICWCRTHLNKDLKTDAGIIKDFYGYYGVFDRDKEIKKLREQALEKRRIQNREAKQRSRQRQKEKQS